MIHRFVRMYFTDRGAEEFVELFNQSEAVIEKFNGCMSVSLMRDPIHTNQFLTYSIWQSEEDLNAYRDSDFFRETWAKTKSLFDKKAEAWSMQLVYPIANHQK
ncbi:MAG: antibiotic biosynthesis monooxygenase [Saprospiraceae bacterium]|nr:antibiotic biosynthesis monooxygenase [Saprospiraceae bacterium]